MQYKEFDRRGALRGIQAIFVPYWRHRQKLVRKILLFEYSCYGPKVTRIYQKV